MTIPSTPFRRLSKLKPDLRIPCREQKADHINPFRMMMETGPGTLFRGPGRRTLSIPCKELKTGLGTLFKGPEMKYRMWYRK